MNTYKALLLITFFTCILSDITYTSKYTYSKTDCFASGKISSSNKDENVVLVQNGGNFSMYKMKVDKTGDASNLENAKLYGVNAAFLVTKSSTGAISESTIKTNGKGANAFFSYGANSIIDILYSDAETKGSNSGLIATDSGTINAYHLNLFTYGESSPSFAAYNDGLFTLISCNILTFGKNSPVIYSKGTIKTDGIEGSALDSQMIVVDGAKTVKFKDSRLYSSGNGGNNENSGIFIYQSTERGANDGAARFVSSDSSFSIFSNSTYYQTAPMFYVTNTEVEIIFFYQNSFQFGSGIFLKAESNDKYGTTGKNGGKVSLFVSHTSIEGDIICGKDSTISIFLIDGGSIRGKITIVENGIVNIYAAGSSAWTLTGDSTVTNYYYGEGDINENGYTLTKIGNEDSTLGDVEFPEKTVPYVDAITTEVKCSNKAPSDNNGDSDDGNNNNNGGDDDDSKGKFLYVNLLSILFLILNL
jgi:hypothetical protein